MITNITNSNQSNITFENLISGKVRNNQSKLNSLSLNSDKYIIRKNINNNNTFINEDEKLISKSETKLKFGNLWRTLKLGSKGIFSKGEKLPNIESNIQKRWHKTILKVLPGETLMGPLAKIHRTEEEKLIPTESYLKPIDPKKYMPNLVFSKNEDSFPVRADFDNNGDVNNNAFNYKHGGIVTENQKPSVYTHVRKKGEYVVLLYWLYYVDNKHANYHNHDWQQFAVYLKENKKTKELEPKYLLTHWHHARELIEWDKLKKDKDGHTYINIGQGSHGALPYLIDEKIKFDSGYTLHHDGIFEQRKKNGKKINSGLDYLSEDLNLLGTQNPEKLSNGESVLIFEKYDHSETILGFVKTGKHYEGGPATNENSTYFNPYHPSLFGKM